MAEPSAALAEMLRQIGAVHERRVDLSLHRIIGLLRRVGDPQLALPPVIHVAGTNGKGSTIAFLRASLEAAGWRVHTYISPHLVHFSERIRLARQDRLGSALVSDDALIEALDLVRTASQGVPPTFFEVVTAAAFWLFARHPADVVLLEAGLGGRLDATNVVEQPLLGVITPVALDHQDWLGPTLADIAREKAGIIKPGMMVVLAGQQSEARAELLRRVEAVSARLFCRDRDYRVGPGEGGGFIYTGRNLTLTVPEPGLAGRHQHDNAATSLACLDVLAERFPVSVASCRHGITDRVCWPARMQRLHDLSVFDAAWDGTGWQVWLDGGHNGQAGQVLADHLRADLQKDAAPWYLVLGMISSKDCRAFVLPFTEVVAGIWCVDTPGSQAGLSGEELAQKLRDHTVRRVVARSAVRDAVVEIRSSFALPGKILITGSLYLAGAVLGAMASGESEDS